MDAEREQRWLAALGLLGNYIRFNHLPAGTGYLCTRATTEGMVELEGLPGKFAAHLFTIDGEVEAVPVLGTVN